MSIKQSYLYFFIVTVTAIALRTLMLFFTIDTTSGFIKGEYTLVATLMLAVITVAIILVFVFAMLTKKTAERTMPNNVVFKIVCPILAAVILYDTFFSTMDYSLTAWHRSAEFILAVVAAASLIAFSIIEFFNFKIPPLLTAAPILFWFMRLIIIFTSFSTLSNIPDNMFELAALCMILVASLQFSKLACTELSPLKQTCVFATALSTASICFVTSIPRAIVTLSENSVVLHRNDLPIMTTLVAGIYFLIFALSCYPAARK